VCDPTNTQNVWVANFTGVTVAEIARITLPFQVAVATLAAIAAVAFGPALFGVPGPPAFALASAATPQTYGLAPESRNTIAVVPAAENASAAAEMVFRTLRSWGRYHALLSALPASDAGCLAKRYAAALVVSVEPFGDSLGGGNDVGIRLEDCAGWPVDEWHETCDATRGGMPCSARIEEAALGDLFRMRTWSMLHPELATTLFEEGLAYQPGSPPTYFYSLFKTSDGMMRAFVRPDGPAYLAGLRTNDIVEKVDGKFWWEYGTFVTQQFAHDGKPHTFSVRRKSEGLAGVDLGAVRPFFEARPVGRDGQTP
jgi:hypothetical protein